MNSCTRATCRGSVVRMKSSFDASMVCSTGFQAVSTSRSAHSCGVTPLACAVRSTFSPCSSVPVRNQTSSWR